MKTPKKYSSLSLFLLLLSGLLVGCKDEYITVNHGDLVIQVTNDLFTSVNSISGKEITKPGPTEYLVGDEIKLDRFQLINHSKKSISDERGSGSHYQFVGYNTKYALEKKLAITTYDDIPDMAFLEVSYNNKSDKDILIKGWVNHAYQIIDQQDEPPFWAFQGSSTAERLDWIKPITPGFFQENFLGMNSSDYGGGIPVTDIWRKDIGIAIGHSALQPKLISLPTEMKKNTNYATIGVRKDLEYPNYLTAGETLQTIETFVTVHLGDYYNGLRKYTTAMTKKGIQMPDPAPQSFEPIWCAWGYERNFTLDEVLSTLPKVKELGIRWAVLDDGFQIAEGDWTVNKTKFPEGEPQMKGLVDKIHAAGLKAKLWWAPLAADPGSKLLKDDPDMRLYLSNWAPQYITWWDAYYLSPTHPKTMNHTRQVVNMFMKEWKFDGLKLDGQHMNGVAPDHNPDSQLEHPDHSHERLPEFFKLIYDEALQINPDAVVENCPCGTCMSFHNMPYMNQAVSSDPLSSWQIRHKGKTYKALIPNTAYYGDHVELSDNGNDFASSFGIGAVLGTKFTWPKDNPTASASYVLTPEKELKWKKWFSLYNKKMLSKEKYLGDLYDIGYDLPEGHVIQKGDTLHYAFYAPEWNGTIELRGLKDETYSVRNYFEDLDITEVHGPKAKLEADFKDFLLLEVFPKNKK